MKCLAPLITSSSEYSNSLATRCAASRREGILPTFEVLSSVCRRKGCGLSQTACAGAAGLAEGERRVWEEGGLKGLFARKLDGELARKNCTNYMRLMAQSAFGLMT
jgi:hypothetical protein